MITLTSTPPPVPADSRVATTTLHVSPGATPDAPARVRTTTGLLAARILQLAPGRARVALVATGALLLGGDALRLEVVVEEGTRLDLLDVAATVAYPGRGASASWRADLHVGEGSSLTWLGEPLVVAAGSEVDRVLTAEVADGGRLALRDTLVLGRSGEDGGLLRARTELAHGGRPALVEDLRAGGPVDIPDLCVLGGHRVVDQVTTVGQSRVAEAPDGCTHLQLVAPGWAMRWLGQEAHRSPLGPLASAVAQS